MSEIHAKPIVDGKFWIVEENGVKIATLRKNDLDRFILSDTCGETYFNKVDDITKKYGKSFFINNSNKVTVSSCTQDYECHGFPTSSKPFNAMYDVRQKLPLYTKSNVSKSLFCAGYYIIKFSNNWVKSFCPKLITIERNPYKGPFKTELDMKVAMNIANHQNDD